MQIPKGRLEKLKVRDESPIPMTEEALRRLHEKLVRLKEALPKLILDTKTAADYGDRSENAEYQAAKSKLRSTHRQILIIENQIKRAAVIKSGPNASGVIRLGSIVVLGVGGAEKTFQILGSYETDPDKGRISDQSPLGAALMNHKRGDVVTLKTGNGVLAYKVLEIR